MRWDLKMGVLVNESKSGLQQKQRGFWVATYKHTANWFQTGTRSRWLMICLGVEI